MANFQTHRHHHHHHHHHHHPHHHHKSTHQQHQHCYGSHLTESHNASEHTDIDHTHSVCSHDTHDHADIHLHHNPHHLHHHKHHKKHHRCSRKSHQRTSTISSNTSMSCDGSSLSLASSSCSSSSGSLSSSSSTTSASSASNSSSSSSFSSSSFSSSSSRSSFCSSESSLENAQFASKFKKGVRRPQHTQSCTDISKPRRVFEEDAEDTVPLLNEDSHVNNSASIKKYFSTKKKRKDTTTGTESSHVPSRKGTLKKRGDQTEIFRKAKSMEVLPLQNKQSFEGELEEKEIERRKEEARRNIMNEKVKFSAFLNEITRQVISPSRLQTLGVTDAHKAISPAKSQNSEGEGCKKLKHSSKRSGNTNVVSSGASSHTRKHSSGRTYHSNKTSNSAKHHHHHQQHKTTHRNHSVNRYTSNKIGISQGHHLTKSERGHKEHKKQHAQSSSHLTSETAMDTKRKTQRTHSLSPVPHYHYNHGGDYHSSSPCFHCPSDHPHRRTHRSPDHHSLHIKSHHSPLESHHHPSPSLSHGHHRKTHNHVPHFETHHCHHSCSEAHNHHHCGDDKHSPRSDNHPHSPSLSHQHHHSDGDHQNPSQHHHYGDQRSPSPQYHSSLLKSQDHLESHQHHSPSPLHHLYQDCKNPPLDSYPLCSKTHELHSHSEPHYCDSYSGSRHFSLPDIQYHSSHTESYHPHLHFTNKDSHHYHTSPLNSHYYDNSHYSSCELQHLHYDSSPHQFLGQHHSSYPDVYQQHSHHPSDDDHHHSYPDVHIHSEGGLRSRTNHESGRQSNSPYIYICSHSQSEAKLQPNKEPDHQYHHDSPEFHKASHHYSEHVHLQSHQNCNQQFHNSSHLESPCHHFQSESQHHPGHFKTHQRSHSEYQTSSHRECHKIPSHMESHQHHHHHHHRHHHPQKHSESHHHSHPKSLHHSSHTKMYLQYGAPKSHYHHEHAESYPNSHSKSYHHSQVETQHHSDVESCHDCPESHHHHFHTKEHHHHGDDPSPFCHFPVGEKTSPCSSQPDSSRNTGSPINLDDQSMTSKKTALTLKQRGSEYERIMMLQEQNEDLHNTSQQTVVCMECLGAECISEHHQLESELQRTHVELSSMMDKFTRLQASYSSNQQTDDFRDYETHCMDECMDAEHEKLNQRIPEQTKQLSAAKTTIQNLETNKVTSMLREALVNHLKSDDTIKPFNPAVAPPPFQFMDSEHYNKGLVVGDEQSLGPVSEENESGWSEMVEEAKHYALSSLERGQHGCTGFSPWHQEQGHWIRSDQYRREDGDTENESGGEEMTHSQVLQVTPFQFCIHPETLPVPVASLKQNRHGLVDEEEYQIYTLCQLCSPIHILSASLEDISSTDLQQPEHHDQLKSTKGKMDLHCPQQITGEDWTEDELTLNWKKANKQHRENGEKGVESSGLEPMGNLESVQKMLNHFVQEGEETKL